MSCRERESGSYKLPVKEYQRVKKEFGHFWDKHIENAYHKASKAYAKHKGCNFGNAFHSICCSLKKSELIDLEPFLKPTKNNKIAKPQKAILNSMKFNVTIKNNEPLRIEDAFVIFDNETKTIRIKIDESNYAVRNTAEHPLYKKLFSLLHTVKWTSKTGGCMRYSNEYMEEDGPCEPSKKNVLGREMYLYYKDIGLSEKEIKQKMT